MKNEPSPHTISIETIGIYGQVYQNNYKKDLCSLFQQLTKKGLSILIESSFASKLPIAISEGYGIFEEGDLSPIDCLFAIGGDGTILKSLTLIKDSELPVVGINFGRLGFLATVQKDDISILIDALIGGKFVMESRSLLEVVLPDSNAVSTLPYALNEISVLKKDSTSMITINTSLGGEFLSSYWADGLIISTPTGSTGYSLSCGGPIIHPSSKNFVITPVSPHNLGTRPLVVPNDLEIVLKVSGRAEEHILSLDSRMISVKNETLLKVKKAPFRLFLIRLEEDGFFGTLRKKLLWGEDKRN